MGTGDSGSFTFANPRTVHWGAGTLAARLDEELVQRRLKRAFMITTRSVASTPELAPRVQQILGDRFVGQFAGITQHAPASAVAAAVQAAVDAAPDVLVSLGGGSPIDATKAVVFALGTGLDVADPAAATNARAFRPAAGALLPHLAIPTTLSAAELSGLAGITTETEHEKVGLRGEALIPAAVFFDAELSLHTPLDLWLSTGIRAIDHAVETLLASGSHPYPDTLAREALRRLQSSLLSTRADPGDLASRTESQLGAWFSFALPGPAASGLSHTLGKRIGSRHSIPHGVCSCLLLPHVMRYLAPRSAAAQARIAAALGVDSVEMPVEQAAACAANRVAELVHRLELPEHLSAYGLSAEDLESAARPVASDAYPLEDLIAIYAAAQ